MFSNVCTFFLFSFLFFYLFNTPSLSLSLFHTPLSVSTFFFFYLFFFLSDRPSHHLDGQGITPSVMAPLPKRAALEKANGATAMFNTGMLQYQQALANMQFQQQAAFLPSGTAPLSNRPADDSWISLTWLFAWLGVW